jgi:hypothetical protein
MTAEAKEAALRQAKIALDAKTLAECTDAARLYHKYLEQKMLELSK